jgi:hypothetical protein
MLLLFLFLLLLLLLLLLFVCSSMHLRPTRVHRLCQTHYLYPSNFVSMP